MGRASNRKKTQCQTGQGRKPDLATQRQISRIMARLQALSDGVKEHLERADVARRIWAGGTDPIPAKAPQWPDGSLGGRFFSHTFVREARKAPPLADAVIPAPAVIAADSAHWNVATNALIRAVAYDGLGLDRQCASRGLRAAATRRTVRYPPTLPRDREPRRWRAAEPGPRRCRASHRRPARRTDNAFRAGPALPQRLAIAPLTARTVCHA